MSRAEGSYRASRNSRAIFLIMFAVMVVVPWTGFIQSRPGWVHFGVTVASGMAIPLFTLDSWRDRLIGAGLFAPVLFVPAMIVSDLLAHLIWNGDVLY